MSTADPSLVKIYSDRAYTWTTIVRHQGTAIAFAMDQDRRIVHTVLDLSSFDGKRGELDAAYWSENPAELPFPSEIVTIGHAVVGATAMPVVKTGGRTEASEDEEPGPGGTDAFLSSTARLTAGNVPFQVVSDGTHVVVLRQAIAADHPDAVFALTGGGCSGDRTRDDLQRDLAGNTVPVVADTLLCDRFLLVGGRLKPVSEVRFRRSRHKTEPGSAKDSLGAADMDGKPFFEPTQELAFIRNLTGGRFTAVLTPTAVHGRQRWQFFAHNGSTGRIDSFNVSQAADGLFDTRGSRYWTSPDEKYRSSVFEREPGTCPFTGLALVPVASESRHAETALRFEGDESHVDLGNAESLRFGGGAYTVEAWIRREFRGGPLLARWPAPPPDGYMLPADSAKPRTPPPPPVGFELRIRYYRLILCHDDQELEASHDISDEEYTHVAAVFDGSVATLYVNGAFSGSAVLPRTEDNASNLWIGASQDGGGFSGEIDEVRIWNRARAHSEIADDRVHRLIGNEPGLIAYYRFDEGKGTQAYDQTDNGAHGTLVGAPQWVTSEAGVGDHPGVRRDAFAFAGREVVSGLSAALHYQQEAAVSGYGEQGKPTKRQARVLLACATRPVGDPTAEAHIATIDFGVGADGRLADVPDVLPLTELGRPVEETADRVAVQQGKVSQLEEEAASLQDEIAALGREKAGLESESAEYVAAAGNDPTKWAVWIRLARYPQYLHCEDGGNNDTMEWSETVKARWQLMALPGVQGRYGNPAVALVNLDAASQVLEADGLVLSIGAFPMLRRRPLGDPLPTAAQWYVKGDLRTGFQLQSALYGSWLHHNTLRAEHSHHALQLEKAGIAPDPQLQLKQDRIAAIAALVPRRTRDLEAKRAQLVVERAALARLSGALLGTADLVLPVPHIGVDASGLSCAGAVLKFARSHATPFLMDSAAGRVALYFRGTNEQLFAAYLDTTAVRGVQQIATSGVTTLFTARDPGVDMGPGTEIVVADSRVDGQAADELCELTITRGSETETFTRLPRTARDLVAIVNGVPEEPVQVGLLAGISQGRVRLTEAAQVAVPAYAYLLIGSTTHLVKAAAAVGANSLRVTPLPSAGVAVGTPITLVRYDSSGATASEPGVSLTKGSRWITVSADREDLPVPNGTATVRVSGHGSQWRGDSPGRAFSFNGSGHRLSLPAGLLDRVTVPAGDLTAEAWVNPRRVSAPRSRVLHLTSGGTRTSLALVPGEALGGGMAFDGSNDAVLINGADPTQTDFTIECWLKRTANRTVLDTVVSCATNGLAIGFTANGRFSFGYGSGTTAQTLTTTASYNDGEWHHWAVTFDRTSKVQIIYRDGAEVARRTATTLPGSSAYIVLGRTDTGSHSMFSGRLAELRTWHTVRSAADISADRHRRVPGDAPGLTGAWLYARSRLGTAYTSGQLLFEDRGPHARHGGVWGDPATADSVLLTHRFVAAVGDRVRQSRGSWPCGEWAHLAAVFEQSWALRFGGGAWAETPDADALDITGDLTIEVFARIDAIGSRQGLLSKGRLTDGAGGSVPYQLSVLADGKLEFAFEESGPVVRRFTSASALTAGFHRIAVVRRAGRTTQEVKGKRSFPVTSSSGTTVNQEFDVVERVDVEEWQDIQFVVDTVDYGTSRYTGPGPRGNDAALTIGQAGEGVWDHPLTGTCGEVRIWNRARERNQLGTVLQPRDEGLAARWTFEENEGNTTADSVGGHDLKLRGVRWTDDPDPRASAFTLYRDGRPLACDTPSVNPLTEWGEPQLTLGAVNRAGTFGEYFDGVLEEVRLWHTARTHEQLLDALFTRLQGDKENLLGYWPFDANSTASTADSVRDHSSRGNHLDPGTDGDRPAIVLSTAPVSTDTAAIRSALAGLRTPFHRTAAAGPAATEYADLQYGPTGEAYGVLKRCYAHITDGSWQLTTGYKVGELVSEWVSQVQFDPQLMGYIEGAPPVPSENLTGGIEPEGCSKVTFQQAEEVTSSLSSSTERSVDTSFTMTLAHEVNEKTLQILAPLGLGIARPLVEVDLTGSVAGGIEFSNGWTSETSVSQGTSTERNTSASLNGSWEEPGSPLNEAIGRRFVPFNNGYALVQSETADVYALRLAHTGALVAYRMLPNPDIPKDWNVISFPINPQYTKQGTLDGAVGFDERGKVFDPAYTNAGARGEYSYFKPREAYAIKRRILRERQQLENYYRTVSTESRHPDPTLARAQKVVESFVGPVPQPETAQPSATADAFANRNIANTYVWTADGGFFAETTGTVDVVTETTGGSYSVSGTTTGTLEVGVEIFGVGFDLQFEASVGGGMTRTRTRAKEATRSHSLDVECEPSRDLQKYDDGQPVYDAAGKPVLVPGKVDAYRFMSFFLGQDTTHFDDFYHKVADPLWLADSTDANAAALRQARHSARKPPCWRVLHRVTYVSRVLPGIPADTAPPLEKALHDVDVASNYELIRRLDPYVSTATGSRAALADATRAALAAHLPRLLPHEAEIAQYLADYYGITD